MIVDTNTYMYRSVSEKNCSNVIGHRFDEIDKTRESRVIENRGKLMDDHLNLL